MTKIMDNCDKTTKQKGHCNFRFELLVPMLPLCIPPVLQRISGNYLCRTKWRGEDIVFKLYVYIVSKLYIRSGSYFHTRWGLWLMGLFH